MHQFRVPKDRYSGVAPLATRCGDCRTALIFFGSFLKRGKHAELWFCRRCDRQAWRLDGVEATMAEIRGLVTKKAGEHSYRDDAGQTSR